MRTTGHILTPCDWFCARGRYGDVAMIQGGDFYIAAIDHPDWGSSHTVGVQLAGAISTVLFLVLLCLLCLILLLVSFPHLMLSTIHA